MELLLKREEKSGVFSTSYDLFAKLELKPEEQKLMWKAKPELIPIIEDEYRRNNTRWRLMLIPAGMAAIVVAAIVSMITDFILFLPVALISWLPLRKLLFKQVTGNVTAADIIAGRTIHCKSLDELLVKEQQIKEKMTNYCQNMENWHAQGNTQRIDLSRG
jgi:hypothetical protein